MGGLVRLLIVVIVIVVIVIVVIPFQLVGFEILNIAVPVFLGVAVFVFDDWNSDVLDCSFPEASPPAVRSVRIG